MTITIIGGQRKWFQSVADEMNFELVHNNGKSPDRVKSGLERSNAMFMIIEATSHNATYQCIETAKKCGIPFYRLRGSKSRLKTMIKEMK